MRRREVEAFEVAMSESNQSDKHALECLRLEADCRELAKNTPDPELELHYLKMADHWSALSVSGPVALSGESDSDADTKDT